MSTIELASILVYGLLVVVLVAALDGYIRRRDPVSRAVALMFSPFLGLLITSVWRQVAGSPPAAISIVAALLFLLQPVFAIYLVSLIRPVSRIVLMGAAAVIAVAIAPALVVRPITPVLSIIPLMAYVAVEGLAAAYLLLESRRRSGPGVRRLQIAAASTAVFAAALLVTGARVIDPRVADAASLLTLLLGLVAAVGYLVAFSPTPAIRRVWQAGTTMQYQHELMARAGESVDAIWAGYAALAASVTGGAVAVVSVHEDGDGSLLATWGVDVPSGFVVAPAASEGPQRDSVALDARRGQLPPDSLAGRLADCADAALVSTVTIPAPDGKSTISLIVLSTHHRLFHRSDLAVLATLGAQTAIVAERRAVLADEEAMAQRLAMTVEALRSASEAKSDFLASMSHELRTPLSAILGFSDLMRNERTDDDDGSVRVPLAWVEHIHRGGEHLLGVVNDVLDLAKVEAGRIELRPLAIDLPRIVLDIIDGIQPLAERKALRLSSTVGAITVVADPGRLRQVLYNLLSNAIKFTPNGGEIRVEAEASADEVRIAVIDSGIGIAPEDQAAVFDEFRQVGPLAPREGGTGLGLALSRRLVEAHEGRIELESAPGVGSRFTVILPARKPDESAGRTRGADPGPVRRATRDASDVLIIEDDAGAVRLLREYLEPAGYAVREASDGDRGLALARERAPAAVILDILLPTIDGWEVLRRIRDDPALRDVPVVLVTVVDEREVGLALGAADYLVKPVGRDALLAALERQGARPATHRLPRVLAVDDDPLALALIRATLEGSRYDVVTAVTGREAIEQAQDGGIDVIICDLVMPDIDGFGVVAALKGDETTADIPILVCTGHDLTDADKARLNGQILGVVAKGRDARDGVRTWLETIDVQRVSGDAGVDAVA